MILGLSVEDALLDNGFSPDEKTPFLWEGVSYYLPENVVRNVLKFVSVCAQGSSILFDYSTRHFVQGDLSSYGRIQIAQWLKRIKEPFLFGMNANQTGNASYVPVANDKKVNMDR